MRLISLWGITLALATWMASACAEETEVPPQEPGAVRPRTAHQEANSTRKVLILGSSVSGGASSMEAQAATSLGFAVEVVTPAQWEAKTSEQFMSYRALIIGDAACTSGEAAFQAAINSKHRWGRIIDGNIVIIASNPASNSTTTPPGIEPIVLGGVELAVERPLLTGMYISLGCAYQSAPPSTQVPLLSPFGVFTVAGFSAALGHAPAQSPPTFSQYVSGGSLTGADGQSTRTVFITYPDHDFSVGALAVDETGSMPGAQSFYDYDVSETFTGAPFVLIRGVTAAGFGCGGNADNQPSGEECDLLDNGNGGPATNVPPEPTCSWTCKTSWCGNGIVEPSLGEECDQGTDNGRDSSGNIGPGSCSGLCRLLGHWPVARCKDVSVLVTNICGASAAIDNGSSDPDNDLVGCTQDPPGPYPIGTTELVVTLSCTDSQNQSATCTGKVTVTDGVVPELVLNGPATQTLECLSAYTDPGAIANDLCSGDLSASIVTTGTVNKDTPGTYTVSYNVTDASGNSPAPVTRTVTVNDTQYPIIMLDGPNPMVLECALGNLDNDPMATVSDACHGNTSHTVFREFTDLNINQVGNYFARYQGDDTAGHAVQITRNVNVVDTTAPVLTVWTPTETVECGIQPSLGVTATDACYGNVPVIATPASLPSAPGPYTVTYSAVDPSGNGADGSNSVVRTITVVDSEPPTLVSPVRVLTLACGEPLSLDVVATDGCEGDLSSQVQLVAPDLTQPGTYPVHYHVSDSSGNTARSAPFTVTIPDPRQPVLTARGHSELTLECNVDAYVDPGAQAWDGCSTPLPLRKYNSGQDAYGPGPDTSKEGTYYVEYFARNEKWHVLRALRAVTVVDRIPPVLTLQGAAHLMHNCGSSWVDPGAEALDTCYGDLGSSVVRTGQVNVNVGGLYTLRYEVKDSAGLSAPPVERTVQIVGCPP